MSQDHDGVEIEVLGASKLTGLYGFWPSFHDATVESILIGRVGPTVTIRFETCDLACDGDTVREPDRRARVVLRWHEVEDLELRGIDPEEHNWIDGLTFGLRDGGIRSELLLMDGLTGGSTPGGSRSWMSIRYPIRTATTDLTPASVV